MRWLPTIACLTAAGLWAVSLSLYKGAMDRLHPATINLFKCSVALTLYLTWILAAGTWPATTTADWMSLAASGVLGFAVGDWALFVAVREGGLQRALVLFNTSPLMTLLAAIPLLGEIPTPAQGLGTILVLAGVALVEVDPRRQGATAQRAGRPRRLGLATLAGVLAAAGQAAGILFARQPLQHLPVLVGTSMRLAAAVVVLVPLALWVARAGAPTLGGDASAAGTITGDRGWRRLLLPTLLGTVVALPLAMRGVQDLEAGTAAALLATTPIFALPIARFVLREPIGPASIAGTLLAVAGVILL